MYCILVDTYVYIYIYNIYIIYNIFVNFVNCEVTKRKL